MLTASSAGALGTVSGIVLAGGRSRRMGVDKRHVRVLDVSLLDRAVALLQPLTDDLLIVTSEEAGTTGRAQIISDTVQGRGPMAGLLTGLHATRHRRALVVPVDMPLLTTDLLAYLAHLGEGWDVVVLRWRERIEPLVGVYSVSCTAQLKRLLAQHRASLGDFVRSTDLTVRYVRDAEIRRFGDPARLFFNVNTREDIRAVEAMLAGPSTRDPPAR